MLSIGSSPRGQYNTKHICSPRVTRTHLSSSYVTMPTRSLDSCAVPRECTHRSPHKTRYDTVGTAAALAPPPHSPRPLSLRGLHLFASALPAGLIWKRSGNGTTPRRGRGNPRSIVSDFKRVTPLRGYTSHTPLTQTVLGLFVDPREEPSRFESGHPRGYSTE